MLGLLKQTRLRHLLKRRRLLMLTMHSDLPLLASDLLFWIGGRLMLMLGIRLVFP